jgi:hypothetical protein
VKKNNGQILVILILIIPLFLLIFGLLAREGGTALAHDRIENHCDKKILDALEIQGRALAALGKINPIARTIITSRRSIDPLVAAGVVYLVPVQQGLYLAQSVIARSQKLIETKAVLESKIVLSSPIPKIFAGKIKENYKPIYPSLHIEPEKIYQNEEGPPLQPTEDFREKQMASGSIKIFTERFLGFWPNPENHGGRAQDMTLNCKAVISMERLEEKWTAELTKSEGRP